MRERDCLVLQLHEQLRGVLRRELAKEHVARVQVAVLKLKVLGGKVSPKTTPSWCSQQTPTNLFGLGQGDGHLEQKAVDLRHVLEAPLVHRLAAVGALDDVVVLLPLY